MKAVMRFILVILCVFANAAYALDQTETGFFYPIGTVSFNSEGGTWLGRDAANESASEAPHYFDGFYHNGVDMMAALDANVYAVADGTIYRRHCDDASWGPGNCALFIKHKTHDGQVFTGLYGHLSKESLPAGNDVYAGKPIGKTGNWCCGIHLHFGVFLGSTPPSTIAGVKGWGMMANSQWNATNSFINPVEFIQTNYAFNPSTERQTMCQGDICWEPKTTSCETATSRYRIVSLPYAQPEGSSVCGELQANLTYITNAPNPQERIPEDHGWRKWWRAVVNFFGKVANAAEIRSFGTVNTINVYTGTVVAGNATLAVHGAGAGYITEAADSTLSVPPDFIVRKTWLVTPWGTETYKFGMNESFDTKAQSENIGDGNCVSGEIDTITGHFYLSRGYKEDVHSGDGAWRRVDSTTTQCGNLQPGNTHTETKNTVIGQWITAPGIYNIVYCIDHPLDDHNNGGDHREKHESNNCSTEAVFEVTADSVVNVPDVDFIASGLTFLQAPIYAGDFIRLGAWVTNQGTVNATADIRSSYTVSCNGGPTTMLTDDGTMASTLVAGASAWEEIITPVQMPNVTGTCIVTFTADYQGAVAETNEGNNSQSIAVTLAPRPAPRLVITRFEDKVGCCTTNTGAAPKPRIWVRNDGPVAPGANVMVVYQVSSPIGTGGAYQTIGYGTIEPRELAPGDTDEDQMDCDGCWRIPQNSAWKKQWHTFRACLRADGSYPTGDPNQGDICAAYARYSKK